MPAWPKLQVSYTLLWHKQPCKSVVPTGLVPAISLDPLQCRFRLCLMFPMLQQAFLIKGFTNWEDTTRVFSKHETSDFHKQAVADTADIGVMLSSQLAKEKQANCEYLLNVMSISPGFRVLCPTRWTVCAASMNCVLDNYSSGQ